MKRLSVMTAGILAVLATMVPSLGADDCTATFSVELVRQENSLLEFEVEVTTNASKVRVEYLFVVNKTTRSGELKTVTVPRVVKINDTTSNEFVNHTLESGETLAGTEARLVSCKPQA